VAVEVAPVRGDRVSVAGLSVVVDPPTFRRLVAARELLADGTLSVREVAEQVRLSPFHFIRVHRKGRGHSAGVLHIKLTSIMVEDQGKALAFYTEVLGFAKKLDVPVGEYRWITVTAPGRDDLQLALEPNANPAGKTFQRALFEQGIPATAFESTDLEGDYARLTAAGVAFTKPPTVAGPVKLAVLADTVGNLIQLYQPIRA